MDGQTAKSGTMGCLRMRAAIRTIPRPNCHLCGGPGQILHEKVKDFMIESSEEWTIKKCVRADCGLLWLDPFPLEEDLPLAYQKYYTHSESPGEAPKSGKLRDV